MNVLEELAARKVADESEDREGWLAARRDGITATEVAKLAQRPAYVAELRREKAGEGRFVATRDTARGKQREPEIAAIFEGSGLTGTSGLYRAKNNPRHLASPDMIGEDFDEQLFLGEIKTSKYDLNPLGQKFASTYYADQMQWQMYVTGAVGCRFIYEQHDDVWPEPVTVSLNSVWVERDDDRIAELIAIADAFIDGEPVAGVDYLIREYLDAKRAKADAVERFEDAEEQLRLAFPDGGAQDEAAGRVSVSVPKPSMRFDSAGFKAAEPDLFQKWQKPTKPGKARVTVTERTND